MKTFLLLGFWVLLITPTFSYAQVRRIVLLEEATNASCPDCFKSNLKLQEFFKSHFGGVISVRYHASWPGSNDPMYALNPWENMNRIHDYYGMYFVADYFMDGIDQGEPLDSFVMADLMRYHLSKDAPVKIKIAANIDADSVRATLRLIGVSPVSQTNLKFRTAVIERMVQYSSPPGSNGETKFPDVMRKMLPDTNGYAVNHINPGEEIRYFVSYPVNPAWNWRDLAVVGWLQSDENQRIELFQTTDHEIIQSNISIPTYVIESNEPLAELLSANQHDSRTLKIVNDNDVRLDVRLKVTEAQLPVGWSYNFTCKGVSFDSIDVAVAPGDSVVFGLTITTNSNPGAVRLAVFAQNLDDPYNYGYTASYFGVTKTETSKVLFIDDDAGGNSETSYLSVFDSMRVRFMSIDRQLASVLRDQLLAEHFKALFWSVTDKSPRLSPSDVHFLEKYLDNGGDLFWAVSDPGIFGTNTWGLIDWNDPVVDFCDTYLDASVLFPWGQPLDSFTGIEGTLGSGITTNLSGSSHVSMRSFSGASDSIFQYTGTSYAGGLSYDAGTYRTVFLGAGLEQFTSASARYSLIQRVINWFEIPLEAQNVKSLAPARCNLEQNYPNPFNPNATIKYSVAQHGRVTIKLFDIMGREVATLVDETRGTGSHEVNVNVSNLASGVYFYRMMAPDFVSVKKMSVIR